jgi:C1A family cysteine protease
LFCSFFFSTANAVAGIYEYLIKKSTKQHIDVSRLFIYYNARRKEKEKENLPIRIADEGATITSTIDTIKELGTCVEANWPYLKAIVNEKPTRDIYHKAKELTVTEALEIPVDLYYMKSCLAQGFPFLFGIQLYESFNKAASNRGVVPVPKASMAARAVHGR